MQNTWAEAEQRIATVHARDLRKDIARLAGAPFWAQIEALHKTYGDALGITKGKDAVPSAARLVDALRAAQRAIANYLLQVAAAAANDDSFVEQAKSALTPVDAVREAAAKRSSAANMPPPVTPETPLPPEPVPAA